MTVRIDFTSQDYLRNPAAGIERLRTSRPIVKVRVGGLRLNAILQGSDFCGR